MGCGEGILFLLLINGWREAGLIFPSVATGTIRTIKQDMIARKLGTMPQGDMHDIGKKLRSILEIGRT